ISMIGNTNLQGQKFDEYYIKEVVNKRYDLLVIGGGGIIHGAHWPNGWFWLINKELIQEIKIPFIVYGVGYNYWLEEGGIPERGKVHLEETLKHAAYFSVRNDGSADRLKQQTGISAPVVPDPGFHVGLNTHYPDQVKEPYVLIQIANDKPENRFGSTEQQAQFIKEMRQVVRFLAEQYKVILAPHVIDDVTISQEIVKEIANAEVWDFGYFAFDHSDQAVAYYKHAAFVIAMRGHGQILPIGFNTPVIALENHPKHRGLMQELDLLTYNLKVNQENLANHLIDCIKQVVQNKEQLVSKYRQINKQLDADTHKGFQDIIKSISR